MPYDIEDKILSLVKNREGEFPNLVVSATTPTEAIVKFTCDAESSGSKRQALEQLLGNAGILVTIQKIDLQNGRFQYRAWTK